MAVGMNGAEPNIRLRGLITQAVKNVMMKIRINQRYLNNKYLSFAFRIILGVIFIIASYDKILNPAEFAIAIDNYRIVPRVFINISAIVVPWFEFNCGLLLLLGVFNRASALALLSLSIIFIFMLASAIIRGLDINCGCFGTGSAVSFWRILEDCFMVLMALYIFKSRETFAALENIWKKKKN
jgi:putative oxidoreductase